MKTKLKMLQTYDPIWKPYAHEQVTIKGTTAKGDLVYFSILGRCFSEFVDGPNLCQLADVAGEIFGPGFYGLAAIVHVVI